MWAVAFASMGALYASPPPFVLIKPILAPFALIGSSSRWWWAGLAIFLMCLPFGSMWAQWFQVTVDSGGATYAFGDWVPMLIPVVAAIARTCSSDRDADSGLPSLLGSACLQR